jgi:hypothetical protein
LSKMSFLEFHTTNPTSKRVQSKLKRSTPLQKFSPTPCQTQALTPTRQIIFNRTGNTTFGERTTPDYFRSKTNTTPTASSSATIASAARDKNACDLGWCLMDDVSLLKKCTKAIIPRQLEKSNLS